MESDEKDIGLLPDLPDLEARGVPLVEALGGDVQSEEARRLLDRLRVERGDHFFSEVLSTITSERYPEDVARDLWQCILEHKWRISEKLKRNVGVRVAALDYLTNVKAVLLHPRLVTARELDRTIKMARTDPLTGLYNRRHMFDQLGRMIEAASRMGAMMALVMTDLDGFKAYNDAHGHQAGDLLLQEVARLTRQCLRKSDLVSRYGGDEFALLLPKASKADALQVAEKLRRHIQDNCQEVGVTMSLGLAHYPEDAVHRDDMIEAADLALYRAKHDGRNRVSFYRVVEFVWAGDEAGLRKVDLVGEFNRWNRRAHPLKKRDDGTWSVRAALLPGRYAYKFVLNDERWVTDPAAFEQEPDGYGQENAVIEVPEGV